MPHLRFEMNFQPSAEEKKRFAAAVVRHFSEIMDTGTDHIGVTLRSFSGEDLTFGRAADGGRIVFVDADIRLGRTSEQKRRLALAFIHEIARTWEVAPEAVYVVYSEHDGEHFQLSDRVLPSWTRGEDPLADTPSSSSRSRDHRARPRNARTRPTRARKSSNRRRG